MVFTHTRIATVQFRLNAVNRIMRFTQSWHLPYIRYICNVVTELFYSDTSHQESPFSVGYVEFSALSILSSHSSLLGNIYFYLNFDIPRAISGL